MRERGRRDSEGRSEEGRGARKEGRERRSEEGRGGRIEERG